MVCVRAGTASPLEGEFARLRALGSLQRKCLRKARRGALGPGAGPAGGRLVAVAGETPCDGARGGRRGEDRANDRERGDPGDPSGVSRRARNAALTMIVLARRVLVAAFWRATIFTVRSDGLLGSGADTREARVGGCRESKSLDGEQPCEDARDHRAGRAPSPRSKLRHPGWECSPTIQVNGNEARRVRYSATVADPAQQGRPGSFPCADHMSFAAFTRSFERALPRIQNLNVPRISHSATLP